jgi:hypothetical protein
MKDLIRDMPARSNGFDGRECAGADQWRWALGSRQSVTVSAGPGTVVYYRLQFPIAGAKLVVREGERECVSFEARTTGEKCEGYFFAGGSPAGESTFTFHVSKWNEGADRFSDDPRALAYCVQIFDVMDPSDAGRYERLELDVRNSATGERRTIAFAIQGDFPAQRWAFVLGRALERRISLVKHFAFRGWRSTGRDLAFLCAEMNRFIDEVNEVFSRETMPRYRIAMRFAPEMLTSQEPLNEIHKHFEILQGQLWNLSPYFLAADARAKYAISQLNFLCHELEGFFKLKGGGTESELTVTYWPVDYRQDILPDEYPRFTLRPAWGSLTAHYSQPGKDHLQSFTHADELVGRENVSGMRYLSGEFDFLLAFPRDAAGQRAFEAAFASWLRERGYDPRDASLGLGVLVVGELDRSCLGDMSPEEFTAFLHREVDDIAEIRLRERGGRVVAAEYPYGWRDPGYEAQLAGAMR